VNSSSFIEQEELPFLLLTDVTHHGPKIPSHHDTPLAEGIETV
jgi:hypothetical protein